MNWSAAPLLARCFCASRATSAAAPDAVPAPHCRAVVDTDGKVMAPSKLTVTQLAAELQARGLMTEGSRKEMYKRVQASTFVFNSCPRCAIAWQFQTPLDFSSLHVQPHGVPRVPG